MNAKPSRASIHIKKWMINEAPHHIDSCGEVNCTSLVEAWDRECNTGEVTLDPDHIA